jgi:uncharacterized protein (DUF983 family)
MNNMTKAQIRRQRQDEINKHTAEAIAIVQTGRCPQCGSGLRRNLALTGWYQCSQYGAVGFRADDSKPSCSFQCFTV